MDEIDREAIQLCQQTKEKLREIQEHFDKRQKEIEREFQNYQKSHQNRLFSSIW